MVQKNTPAKVNKTPMKKQLQTPTKTPKSVKKTVASIKTPKKGSTTPAKLLQTKIEASDDSDENESDESVIEMDLNSDMNNKEIEDDSDESENEEADDECQGEDGSEDNQLEVAEASEDESSEDDAEPDDGGPDSKSENEDEPDEEQISRKPNVVDVKPKVHIPKLKMHEIPTSLPKDTVIRVSNLPKKFSTIDLIEIFAKFGTITHMSRPKNKKINTTAHIAFATSLAAKASLAANNDSVLSVEMWKPNRSESDDIETTVKVDLLKKNTTSEEVKKHFLQCGEIKNVDIIPKSKAFAFVCFAKKESVQLAMKLNGSELNGNLITVIPKQHISTITRDCEHTIIMKNVQNHESYDINKVYKIFEKFGEIKAIELLCMKRVLGFVTFKEDTSAKKALQELNGKTVDDMELDLEPFQDKEKTVNTTVVMKHIKKGVTEGDIRKLFEETGEIKTVSLNNGIAFIKFKDTDGFCKSFLLHGSKLQNQAIFLSPLTVKGKPQFVQKQQMNALALVKRQFSPGSKRPGAWHGNKNPQNKRQKQDE